MDETYFIIHAISTLLSFALLFPHIIRNKNLDNKTSLIGTKKYLCTYIVLTGRRQ